MSSDPNAGVRNPAGKLTISQFKEVAEFIKDLLADEPAIKWSIIAAGVGGALEALHIVWLALRYIFRF